MGRGGVVNIEVRTQAQLDAAVKKAGPFDIIVIQGDGPFIFTGSSSPTVVARGSSSPTVVARGSSSPRVEAWESSSPRVVARGSSSPRVEAWESSSPTVEARESSSPTVVARGSSSPRVVARESSSPRVEAWESSSPRVVARESSSPRVEAWESSSFTGSIGKYAALVARKQDHAKVTIPGALILPEPKIETPADWCDYYGVTVKRGMATLFKALDDDYSTDNARRKGIFYLPGTSPAAPDWDPVPECGGGLHFSPSPMAALNFNPSAKRFVACPVRLTDIVVHESPMHPAKVKAPRVSGKVVEVDRDGEPLKAALAGAVA
jgi:uncharacterized protein YciI